jgi:MFS family permease
VPDRTTEEIAVERDANYRWNFAVNLLDGIFFWPSTAFISSATILPLYVSKLWDSPLALGLLAVLAQSAWFLPQLFTANTVERLARKKPVPVNLGLILERLPVFLLVISTLFAFSAPALALILFFVGYAWYGFGAGVVATGWQDLLARMFPVERRGRFFGLTMFLGAAGGALGAAVSAWLLREYPFAFSFTLCFAIAFALSMISWGFLALAREPVERSNAPRMSTRAYFTSLPELLQRDANYRRFLVARMTLALGGMGAGFLTVAALQRWNIPDSQAGIYTIVLLAGQTTANLAFGMLADRKGHKLSLEIGAFAGFIGFLLAALARAPRWYYGAFFLVGVASGAVLVSGILVVMEFSTPERRPTYLGIANTGVGLASIVAPLIGAALATVGYSPLFAVSALFNLLAAILFRWYVREPRWA